jgi:hypothetical protein
MIQKYIAILILCLIIAECKVKQPTKELGFSCEIVNNIIEKDKYYRIKHFNILSPYSFLLDSLIKVNGFNHMASVNSTLLDSIKNQVNFLISNRPNPDKSVLDSVWKLQIDLDSKNVMDLISIISNVGYSNIDTIPIKCGMESFVVFVHTPAALCDTVYTLMDKINLKKIDSFRYNHIMWHLNGRI